MSECYSDTCVEDMPSWRKKGCFLHKGTKTRGSLMGGRTLKQRRTGRAVLRVESLLSHVVASLPLMVQAFKPGFS